MIWSDADRPRLASGVLYCQKHIMGAMPLHDIAVLGLVVLPIASILGVRILWDIYKVLVGIHEELQDLHSSMISKD